MATTYTITWPSVIDQGTGPPPLMPPSPIMLTLDSPSVSAVGFTLTDGGTGGTFLPSSAPSIPAGQLSVTVTYAPSASTVDRSITIAVANTAALTDPTPSSRSFYVTNFGYYRPNWEGNMRARLAIWADTQASPAPQSLATQALLYDVLGVYETLRRYTGDTAAFDPCVSTAVYQWRDMTSLPQGGVLTDYNNLTGGLRDHWLRTGDPLSRGAVIQQSVKGTYASDAIALDYLINQDASRPCALAILAMLDAEDCGAAHRARLDHWVWLAMGHIDQWAAPEASWPAYRWLQPFMAGITMQALIAYWDRYRDGGVDTTVTPNVPMTGIPDKIKLMLDTLWTGSNRGIPFWFPNQYTPHSDFPAYPFADGIPTPNGPTGTGAFGYFYPRSIFVSPPPPAGGDPVPLGGLNLFIAPAFYWYQWYATVVLGDFGLAETYRRRGDAAFAGAKTSFPASMGGNLVTFNPNDQKNFNEHYWRSVQGVEVRDRTAAPRPATTAVTLAGPSPASGAANAPSGFFTVALAPPGSATRNPVVATPVVPGGRAIPTSLTLTADRPTQKFRVVPGSASAGTSVSVSVTLASTAPDVAPAVPAPVSYAVGAAAPTATGYTIAVPANPVVVGPHLVTDPFTVGIDPAGSAPGPAADATGGLLLLGLGDFGRGGLFRPAATWVEAVQPTTTFVYQSNGTTSRSVAATNALGLPSSPTSAPVVPTATDYTMAAPSPATGPVGSPSAPLAVALSPGHVPTDTTTNLPGTIPVTLSDGSGGSFSTATFALSDAAPSVAPTYTPTVAGTRTITATAGTHVLDPAHTFGPSAVAYAATSGVTTGYFVMSAGGGYLVIQAG